jgi:ribosomal protein S12 methylthiotransferase accessory factor
MTTDSATRSPVVGGGMLGDAVAHALGRTSDLVVAASDAWNTTAHADARDLAAARGVPWLPVRTELGVVVIGPLERPGVPGCVRCADLRRRRAREEECWLDPIRHRQSARLDREPSPMLTRLAARTVAALVADEARTLTADPERARTRNALLYVHLDRLTVTRHRFLPDPLCDKCGDLPSDAPELADLALSPRPKPAPGTYRVRDVLAEHDRLLDTYVTASPACGRPRSFPAPTGPRARRALTLRPNTRR